MPKILKGKRSLTDDQLAEIGERLLDSTVNLFEFAREHYGVDPLPDAWERLAAMGVRRCPRCWVWARTQKAGEACDDCKGRR